MRKMIHKTIAPVLLSVLMYGISPALAEQVSTCSGCDGARGGYIQSEQKKDAGGNQEERGDAKQIRCFNCDRRPCVATKEAWLKLWHKYWGTKITQEGVSGTQQEDRK